MIICSVALIALLAQAPVAQGHALAGCSNPNVTGGGSCAEKPVALTAQEQALLAAKTRLANDLAGARLEKVSVTRFHTDLVAYAMALPEPYRSAVLNRANAPTPNCVTPPGGGGCAPSSLYVNLYQQRQTQWYYCGPATASEILGAIGSSYSQSYLAGSSYLKTDEYQQTSWSPYVMAPTLNTLQHALYYQSQDGGAVSSSQWQNDLLADIDLFGQPIAGNTVEDYGGPYLTGHGTAPQSDFAMYHWIAIYGYTNYGGSAAYADSISGNAGNWGWTWAANVPQYSTISSSTMYTLLSKRGWVW